MGPTESRTVNRHRNLPRDRGAGKSAFRECKPLSLREFGYFEAGHSWTPARYPAEDPRDHRSAHNGGRPVPDVEPENRVVVARAFRDGSYRENQAWNPDAGDAAGAGDEFAGENGEPLPRARPA